MLQDWKCALREKLAGSHHRITEALQEWAEILREKLADRHHRIAKHHIARRDYWRNEVYERWDRLLPAWLPWAGLVVFWLIVWAFL